jgi:hypothetical protein
MSLLKAITDNKGVTVSYHKIAQPKISFIGANKGIYVTFACYISQEFKEADEENNILENDMLNTTQTEPDLKYELKEGETGEGWISLTIDKSIKNPKLVYIENYWFLLN